MKHRYDKHHGCVSFPASAGKAEYDTDYTGGFPHSPPPRFLFASLFAPIMPPTVTEPTATGVGDVAGCAALIQSVWVAGLVTSVSASSPARINPHCHSEGDTAVHAHPADVELWLCECGMLFAAVRLQERRGGI